MLNGEVFRADDPLKQTLIKQVENLQQHKVIGSRRLYVQDLKNTVSFH